MALIHILRDFADWTALPGLIQIINALNAVIRMAWIIIWFALWGVFIYEFVLIVQQFFQFSPTVTLSLNYKYKRIFPMVTICNQNPMNYTTVQQYSSYAQINQLMEDYTATVQSGYKDIKNDEFGINSQTTTYSKYQYTREALVLLMNQLSEKKREAAGYSFENFFLNYYWNNAPANRQFGCFKTFLDPFHGLCYQFNAINGTDDLQSSARAGISFALRATILVHQYSPNGVVEYLPTTKFAGLRVAINYPAPGTESFLAMKVTEVHRAKKPYGECVDTMDAKENYYSSYNYTMSYCSASCVQNEYIANCSCAYPLYLKPENASYCTTQSTECVFNIRSNQEQGGGIDPTKDCDCRPSCTDTSYKVFVSSGTFPSDVYRPLSQADQPISPYACTNANSYFNGNLTNCIKWYRDNAVVLNVYYNGLDYIVMTEGAAYTLGQASNDLGGQMGLWTGISLICVIEIVVFIVFMIIYFAFGRKLSNIEIREENRQLDKRYQELTDFKEELDTQEIMDDEIQFRYRELQMRPERLRLERLDEGHRLNEEAAIRAGIVPMRRKSSVVSLED